jgi:WD40 repeat protein
MSSVNSYDFFTEFYNVSNKGPAVKRYRHDFDSTSFQLKELDTDLHHLHAACLELSDQFVILNEPGKGNHTREWSISVYEIGDRDNLLTLSRSFQVEDQSGYFGASKDDRLIAVGVLKEDTINIYEISTGDLLVSIAGGRKTAFWGTLTFLPDARNNALLEFRVLSMKKSKAADSIVRFWDLGFRGEGEDDGDEDEEEQKLWERNKSGFVRHALCGPDTIIATHEKNIDWIDYHNGDILRHKPMDKICNKAVVSDSMKYVAVAHLGHCSIFDVASGEVIGEVTSPDATNDVYPLTPVQFVQNDSILVLRINQDMSLVLSLWQLGNAATLSVSRIGGTISDDTTAISRDESLLLCWPYGLLQVYDLGAMKQALLNKYSLSVRMEMVRLRSLVRSERAVLDASSSATTAPDVVLMNKALSAESCDVFKAIISFV